jgi:2-phosphosulfolactate phosphatase
MTRTVVIDCFPESVERYQPDHAIVAIDVIRATTTAVTAVAQGRRCFPVATEVDAWRVAATLPHALLAGEVAGHTPPGFDVTNSPAAIAVRSDIDRPMVLLSTSGTPVICASEGSEAASVACLRNFRAQAAYLQARFDRVALIGAGSRGEFRDEDALCCAWIASILLAAGFEPENDATLEHVERWRGAPVETIALGRSAQYLRKSGQEHDLEFVLTHVDDLAGVYLYLHGEIVQAASHADSSEPAPADLQAQGGVAEGSFPTAAA